MQKDRILIKFLYFMHYMTISFFVPFVSIYLRSVGFGNGEIGILYAVIQYFPAS